jgi:NADH dehydrogenase/NADH:ubiquinone oxidoreductase subunit G
VHTEKRLPHPGVRRDGVMSQASWDELNAALAELVRPGTATWIASPHQSLEELTLFRELAGDEPHCGGCSGSDRGEADDLLLAADRSPNRTALAWLGLDERDAADLTKLVADGDGPVVVYGGDPVTDVPGFAEALGGRPLVYLGQHVNATSQASSVVAPLSAWAEKDGIFVNGAGRLQAFRRAVLRPETVGEDWRVLVAWLRDRGAEDLPSDLSELRTWTAARIDLLHDVNLDALPAEGLVPAGAPVGTGGEE